MYRCISVVLLLLCIVSLLWDRQSPAQQDGRRNVQPQRMERFRNFPEKPPAVGSEAPDFVLSTLDGEEIRLSDLRGKKYVVLEFGSYT